MLEFWKNGMKIQISPIFEKGKIGQIVIFGERVNWGINPDPEEKPLSKYNCPSIFTIVEKVEGKEGYYMLKDVNGNLIKLQDKWRGASDGYLYDAQEWLVWKDMHEIEKFSRKERKISQLDGNLELLKDIIIKQGIHVVTKEQAEKLGFK